MVGEPKAIASSFSPPVRQLYDVSEMMVKGATGQFGSRVPSQRAWPAEESDEAMRFADLVPADLDR